MYTIQGSKELHQSEVLKMDPLWETTASTDDQGLFTEHIVIPWDRLCTHPASVAMACCDPNDSGTSDWRLLLKAGIDHASEGDQENCVQQESDSEDSAKPPPNAITGKTIESSNPKHNTLHPLEDIVDHARDMVSDHLNMSATAQITIAVSEPKGVRVISDLVRRPGIHFELTNRTTR